VCDLETSRIGAPYIYDISNLRVKPKHMFSVCRKIRHVHRHTSLHFSCAKYVTENTARDELQIGYTCGIERNILLQ